ncbi:transcription termination/antitermination protein NusG [Mycoplasmopsis gallopavonis]|uniref:Transcription termination/antitermination protein NusG n=1 Tax=Mycoplasmopsis gallopavonis TaxID=76629 RepID=A0A449AZ77_9BACT|nr:transcription termination/antitermination protein NusG [Mycoplasmopsis gallopavonis]RIV16958.1 transcription termination/antitermination protein NusG [Mycoplasmopsis gallopavonis]VEU72794.1 Transcription antitermination protein nusG [Mycoplasmopsis gallopavonis]
MNNFKWYMISTVRGKEDNVVESLNNRIFAEQVEKSFELEATDKGPFKIFKKPTLTAKELDKKIHGDAYKVKWINLYPGYIFAKMDMTDKAWFVVRNTQYVTGLVGSSGKGAKPTPVTNFEMKKMFKAEQDAIDLFNTGKNLLELKVGDLIEVIEGPYKGEIAPIEKLILEENMAVISIETFGKKTLVELSLDLLKLSE